MINISPEPLFSMLNVRSVKFLNKIGGIQIGFRAEVEFESN